MPLLVFLGNGKLQLMGLLDGCSGAAAPIASPGEKLSASEVRAAD